MLTLWPFKIVPLLLALILVTAHEFHYPNLNEHQEFPKWGGICDTGVKQSPINLDSRLAKTGFFKPLQFLNYDKAQHSVNVVNNGHTVQLDGYTSPMVLSGGPLTGKYMVEQIHFHWDSEHTINNERYPLEVHIVHKNRQYLSLNEALSEPDGVAVLGLLYHFSNKHDNEEIADVLTAINDIDDTDEVGKKLKLNSPITVSGLFPNFDEYFTYNGSLTTPSCNEVVTWIVSSKTFPITQQQVKAFKTIRTASGDHVTNNYRFVQGLNERTVLMGEARTDGAEALLKAPKLLFALIVLTMFLK